MVLEVFWARMCTTEVLYVGVHSSGNSCLLELEPDVYLLRYKNTNGLSPQQHAVQVYGLGSMVYATQR